MTNASVLIEPLRDFAEAVRVKTAAFAGDEPEDQLRNPFENFMASVGRALGWDVICKGETLLPDRLGKPDFAISLNKLLVGYAELKAPGLGADPKRFTRHGRTSRPARFGTRAFGAARRRRPSPNRPTQLPSGINPDATMMGASVVASAFMADAGVAAPDEPPTVNRRTAFAASGMNPDPTTERWGQTPTLRPPLCDLRVLYGRSLGAWRGVHFDGT